MNWENIIKQEEKALLPIFEKLKELLETRIREMKGFLEDSNEEDEAYSLAEVILIFTQRVNGTGDIPTMGLTDAVENLIKMIDKRYAELVEMMR